jgi:hypothetical protein
VNLTPLTGPEGKAIDAAKGVRIVIFERFRTLYARIALGAAFLSAVADRFGHCGKYGGRGNFAAFTQYTAQLNSFMPAFTISFLAWGLPLPNCRLASR